MLNLLQRGVSGRRLSAAISLVVLGIALGIACGCGGSHTFTSPPVVLTVSVPQSSVNISPGETVYVAVSVVAPTETVSFSILGLPAGVSASYKESESNPSGQLTLTAGTGVMSGSYLCTITVGTLGQTASTTFPLKVTDAGSH